MNTQGNTSNTGGLAGGLGGQGLDQQGLQGQTGQTTHLAGLAGNEAERHREHTQGQRVAGTGAGAKLNPDGTHKVSMGDKISGTVESLVGKATNNPAKVQEGQAKKTGGI